MKGGAAPRRYPPKAIIYRQGDAAEAVFYVEKGRVQLSVVSQYGREGIIAMLGPGEFFGEGALAGQSRQMSSAVAMQDSSIWRIEKEAMERALRDGPRPFLSFLAFVLARNIQIQDDLIDHLFNSSERRLARLLFILADCDNAGGMEGVIPKLKQEVLAARVGTTRARVSHFMSKFRRLGFVEEDERSLRIHGALLGLVVDDDAPPPAAGPAADRGDQQL